MCSFLLILSVWSLFNWVTYFLYSCHKTEFTHIDGKELDSGIEVYGIYMQNIFTYVSWRCDVHCYQMKISFSASDTIISVTWQDNFGTKHHKPHSRHNDKNVNADTSVLNCKWVSNLIFLLVSLSACNSKSQRFRNLILQKRNAYLFVCLFLNTLSLGKMKRESRELRIYNQPESYTMNISRILCEN